MTLSAILIDASHVLSPEAPSIPTSVGVSILFAYILDNAKRLKQVPIISYYTTRLNTILRIVLSGIGTVGTTWVWSNSGTDHQLLITFPAGSVIIAGLWHWAINYGTQHFSEIQLAQRPAAQEAMREQKQPTQEIKPMGVPLP